MRQSYEHNVTLFFLTTLNGILAAAHLHYWALSSVLVSQLRSILSFVFPSIHIQAPASQQNTSELCCIPHKDCKLSKPHLLQWNKIQYHLIKTEKQTKRVLFRELSTVNDLTPNFNTSYHKKKLDYRFYKIIQSSSTPWFLFCQPSNDADIYIYISIYIVYIDIFIFSYCRETIKAKKWWVELWHDTNKQI